MKDAIDGTAAAGPRLRTIAAQSKVAGKRRPYCHWTCLSKIISQLGRRLAGLRFNFVGAFLASVERRRARGGIVSLQQDINSIAPRLRRYAEALVGLPAGSGDFADALASRAMRQVLKDSADGAARDLEIEAYAALTEMNRDRVRCIEANGFSAHEISPSARTGSLGANWGQPERQPNFAVSHDVLLNALLALKLEEREVLLLVVLERFSYARAARTLKVSQSIIVARLARAREHLSICSPAARGTRRRPSYLRLVD